MATDNKQERKRVPLSTAQRQPLRDKGKPLPHNLVTDRNADGSVSDAVRAKTDSYLDKKDISLAEDVGFIGRALSDIGSYMFDQGRQSVSDYNSNPQRTNIFAPPASGKKPSKEDIEKSESFFPDISIPQPVKDYASGLGQVLQATPPAMALRLAQETAKDHKGALPRVLGANNLGEGLSKMGVATAEMLTPAIRLGSEWAGVDTSSALMDEVVNSDKTKIDLAAGQKAFKDAQVLMLGQEVLDLKSKGVSKNDAFAALEEKKKTLPPMTYNALRTQLEQQYKPEGEIGPVKNPELDDLKLRNKNRQEGKGDSSGYVKAEVSSLDPKGALEQAATETGKRAAVNFETPPIWYESDAFSFGLMQFGLNLLSGNDYATSFGVAVSSFDDRYGKEKRQAMANELYGEGYDKQQIMEWIESGDASVLKQPETYSTGRDNFGYYQMNDLTKKKEYFQTKQEAELAAATLALRKAQTAEAVGKSGGKPWKDPFQANAQVQIGAKMMPRASAAWDQKWAFNQNDYPMMTTGGKFSDVVGKSGWGGKFAHNFLLEDQLEARRDEELFMQSYGRPLSGGAIREDEWESWGGYLFPRPEDAGNPRNILQKQLTRDTVANVITYMNQEGYITEENEEAMFLDQIQRARNIATQVTSYDPESGWYQLTGGRYYHPLYGVRK